ncbi:putative lysine biosynthesis protein LysW [Prevotella sp. CAG:386]|nr:putative lysine biosynthesis protein LysW [Prevotella sp. CAG:386]
MEETSKLQVLKCPACNAKLTYFFEFDQVITCPVCHNSMNSHVLQTVEAHMPLRYVSPTIDVDGFKHLMAQTLVDIDFVPCDVFQAIDAEEVFCIYLPMYLYEGTYQVAWSGNGANQQQLHGNATGKMAYLYLANDRKGDLPKELRDFTTCLPYDAEALSSFEAGHIDATDSHILTALSTITAEAVWKKWGSKLTDKLAKSTVHDQIGNQKVRKLKISPTVELTKLGEPLFVSFYFSYYTYNNRRYCFIADGQGKHLSYNNPIDKRESSYVRNCKVLMLIVKWMWMLAVLVWAVYDYRLAMGYLVAWAICKVVVDRVLKLQIARRFKRSKETRQADADLFLGI